MGIRQIPPGYLVHGSETPDGLTAAVNTSMANGWWPQGGIFVLGKPDEVVEEFADGSKMIANGSRVFYQAMTKTVDALPLGT